ncbi:hydrolase [Hymenobacter sp. BT507]|uniref:Hydrolase n=2 Tax=Hymenobacter citatus TaxID=2763506 RepID=A0ABR7MHQ3_9BACT|nr:CPCC family cysteine-rich protein [Hymenobacter citatus]MBC6610622.1 hydrolase [Hymenobacter citatus]
MERKKNSFGLYQCFCCDYFTFSEANTHTFDICPVCFWEDDRVQVANPTYAGGANTVSLLQARKNFALFGVSDPTLRQNVRSPHEDELP